MNVFTEAKAEHVFADNLSDTLTFLNTDDWPLLVIRNKFKALGVHWLRF